MKKIIFSLCFCLLPSLSAGQELFTIDHIRIMHDRGVKVQFNEKAPAHVLPADTSPRDLLRVEMLDFSDSSLHRIPPWLKRFTNLRRLDLSRNHLDADSDLLETLQAMPRLDVLNLSDNPLFTKEAASSQSLAPVWQVLSELGKLYLSGTQGTAKNYGSLAPLWSLKILDISHNRIKDEINVLELNKLVGLQELNLSYNDIGQFPGTELPVQSLKLLDLSHNALTEIPYVEMNQLEIWDLQGNGAARLADDYGDLFSLPNLMKLPYDSGSDYDNLSNLPEGLKKKLNSLAGREKERLFDFFKEKRNSACLVEGRMKIGKYIDHCNGTIADTVTGLIWKRCSEGLFGDYCEQGKLKKYSWYEAIEHFLKYPSSPDWRIPTIDELKSLVYCSNGMQQINNKHNIYRCNDGAEQPTINWRVFPNTRPYEYWSGIPYDYNDNFSWLVHFGAGYPGYFFRVDSYYVRLVRNGQPVAKND